MKNIKQSNQSQIKTTKTIEDLFGIIDPKKSKNINPQDVLLQRAKRWGYKIKNQTIPKEGSGTIEERE